MNATSTTPVLGRGPRSCGMARALALGLLASAGCTVGPDYRAPRVSLQDTPWAGTGTNQGPASVAAPPSILTTQPAGVTNWWTMFRDPVLDSLAARAVQSNLDMKQAESRVRQARAQRGVAAGGLWPWLDAAAEYNRSRRSGGGAGAENLYQAGFDAAWELDVFGGQRREVEAADADIAASVEDRREVLVTLVSEVALNYISLRGSQREIAIAKENLAAQKTSLELTSQLFQGGFRSKLDVANAEALVATTRSQIPLLEMSARQSIYALGLLLASEPSALVAELSDEGPIPPTPPEVPLGLPSDILRRRPDIRRAEALLHGATARIGVATADLFPKFSLTGSLGVSSAKRSSLVEWDSRFYSFGPTVTWAVFRAGAIQANIAVQNELERQALLNYQKTVLAALHDVERALVAYVKEQQHRQALAEAVAANQEAVALATELYKEGQTDFLNVLSAQRSLFVAQDALVQSERDVSADLVSVYKALGGGWETAGGPPDAAGKQAPTLFGGGAPAAR